ncbi:hypothetical protein [Halomonas llamarensis]|uniref:Uncharacterized protein n=1 Tax=Halomonas llamarensis TaxID=2945104 RepID=A0ABT0SVC9_9GAMM|nr:hypothetical protein [Halomonas llamarensis]MCL7931676.1 hypothetical protein [Halomonas llamarensis]
MADFPTIDFGPYEWATLDKNYIVKWNGQLVALNELQANIAAFGQAVEADKQVAVDSAQLASDKAQQAGQDALSTAADVVLTGQNRVATGEDLVATGQDKDAAEQAANTAVQKAQETGLDRTQTGIDRAAAADSAQAAGQSENNAASALADFLKRYLGPHETPPTTDNEGSPLLVGALYLSTAEGDEGMRHWTGAEWVNAYATIDGLTWADVSGKPSLGTSAAKDVAETGNATADEVVKGSDTRLADARTPTAHNHSATQITSGTLNGARLPNATSSSLGGIKVRLNGTTAYITSNGSNA